MQKMSFFTTSKNSSKKIAPEENFPPILALTLKLTQTLTPTGRGRGNFLWGELSAHQKKQKKRKTEKKKTVEERKNK